MKINLVILEWIINVLCYEKYLPLLYLLQNILSITIIFYISNTNLPLV